jgi:hypothetical protein
MKTIRRTQQVPSAIDVLTTLRPDSDGSLSAPPTSQPSSSSVLEALGVSGSSGPGGRVRSHAPPGVSSAAPQLSPRARLLALAENASPATAALLGRCGRDVREMDDGSALTKAAGHAAADIGITDDKLAAGFEAAILKVLRDGTIDVAEKKKKIGEIVDLYTKAVEVVTADEPEADDDDAPAKKFTPELPPGPDLPKDAARESRESRAARQVREAASQQRGRPCCPFCLGPHRREACSLK